LQVSFDQRVRYESRTGNGFGKEPDLATGLARTRLGLAWRPVEWLKIAGTAQDARSPWYGPNVPTSARDTVDLLEAYFEISGGSKTGFGLSAGRMAMAYGDSRLIGSPAWGNTGKTYDHARAWYRTKRAQVDFLFAAPWKIRAGEFNRPVLGEHVWGVYSTLKEALPGKGLEAYWLRHYQNRPGGFTGGNRAEGTDRLSVDTAGSRFFGLLRPSLKFTVEGALQGGSVGPARHRAGAVTGNATRRWTLAGRPFDLLGEYKFASGTKDPRDAARRGVFDQIFASNHDRFGHQDLFGWRNIHNARGQGTLAFTRRLSVNAMYSSFWLASARDSLYNGSGKAIARSATGAAGRHVGQEADLFLAFRLRAASAGCGYGRFFAGGFVRQTTPGANPNYLYIFHQYGF
jgi:hypothetical protein